MFRRIVSITAFYLYKVSWPIYRLFARLDQITRECVIALVEEREWEKICVETYKKTVMYGPGSDRRKLFRWEIEALAETFPKPPSSLLVLGAGGGREMRGLMEMGYRVFGVDPNQTAIESAARQLGDNQNYLGTSDFSHADLIKNPGLLPPYRFDGIVMGWGVISHAATMHTLKSLFRTLRERYGPVPMLISWFGESDRPPTTELCRAVINFFKPYPGSEIARLSRHVGAYWTFPNRALDSILRDSGYKIVYDHSCSVQPHAVIIPCVNTYEKLSEKSIAYM